MRELRNLDFYDALNADLHAIGGLIPLLNYLKNPNAAIRARAAEVVMTMVQNNEKSQKQVMDVRGLQLLLHNFTSDEDMNVRAKALGAISCKFCPIPLDCRETCDAPLVGLLFARIYITLSSSKTVD